MNSQSTRRSSDRRARKLGALTAAVVGLAFATSGGVAVAVGATNTNPYGQVGPAIGGFDTTHYDGGRYDKTLTPGLLVDPSGFAVDTNDPQQGGTDHTTLFVLDRTSPPVENA